MNFIQISDVLPAVIEQGWLKRGPHTSLVLLAQLACTGNNIQANFALLGCYAA